MVNKWLLGRASLSISLSRDAAFNLIFILAQIGCKYQPASVKCNWCLLWADGTVVCCLHYQ